MCGSNPSEFRVCAISVQKQSKTKMGWGGSAWPGQAYSGQEGPGATLGWCLSLPAVWLWPRELKKVTRE